MSSPLQCDSCLSVEKYRMRSLYVTAIVSAIFSIIAYNYIMHSKAASSIRLGLSHLHIPGYCNDSVACKSGETCVEHGCVKNS